MTLMKNFTTDGDQPVRGVLLDCEFEFVCPKTWEELQSTPDPLVRYCPKCEREVTECSTQTQLDDLAERGECVSLKTVVRQLNGSVWFDKNKPCDPETLRRFIDSI